MIELELTSLDLARLRFASSPVWELIASLRTLRDRSRHYMCRPWLSAARGRLGGLRLDLLSALVPPGLAPDFVTPTPTRPWGTLEEELETVATVPAATVRASLEEAYQDQGRPLPPVLRPLSEDPAAHLPALVTELRRYWQAAVEPVWPRLRALAAADLAYRMERFAAGGIAAVLADLHPQTAFAHGQLVIDKPSRCRHRVDLAGTGVLLLPCVFAWPSTIVVCCSAAQPALAYSPRGVAGFWRTAPPDPPDPLGALLGRTRAVLLAALSLPVTTTELARQVGISPPAVSQQLKVLKATGLVTAHRRGRLVVYQRTTAATALLATARPDQTAG